jgi:hypothetical protein
VITGPTAVRTRVLPWLLAVGHELRATLDVATTATLPRVMAGAIDMRPPAYRSSSPSADADDIQRLDRSAGCEFVDDQIRHAE